MTGEHVRAIVARVLEAHASRCCDDAADRDVLADAIAAELALTELQGDERQVPAPCPTRQDG